MMRALDDRVEAANDLMESLGGSLQTAHWEVSSRAVHAIVDLPDSASATAVAAVLSQSGAFTNVDAQEVLTQAQFTGSLELADDSKKVYRVPGQAVLEDDSSESAWRR